MKLTTTVLAAKDLKASVAFYEALGFRRKQGGGALAFLSDGDRTIALAAGDVVGLICGGTAAPTKAPGVVHAYLTRTKPEVDEALAQAGSAGGKVVRPAQDGAWGGYGGSFADLDGHVWAVIHNPALYRA